MTVIAKFHYDDGSPSPLSNFFPWAMNDGPHVWPSVEHYFQAQKASTGDEAEYIRTAATPGIAKQRGRKVQLRPNWDAVKYDAMRDGIAMKFQSDTLMSEYLLSTGDALLQEGNEWGDRCWGVVHGTGRNWLGIILMARRAELLHVSCL